MAFRFHLAPLVRLRQAVERQRVLELEVASARLARAREALAQLEKFLTDAAGRDAAQLSERRTAAELQFAALYRENLRRYGEELGREITKLDEARRVALAEYQRAQREREVLESLRVRQLQIYRQGEARREQRELDAAHLLGRWFRRH